MRCIRCDSERTRKDRLDLAGSVGAAITADADLLPAQRLRFRTMASRMMSLRWQSVGTFGTA
jgi:hypothetical protein